MSSGTRRGGIPGPESRTGLTRPSMTEAEFERRIGVPANGADTPATAATVGDLTDPATTPELESTGRGVMATAKAKIPRAKPTVKPKRVQRMFAIEEEVDKKLWLYAIHVGKDRSEVVNELIRPVVASMVLYDSRDRRAGRITELAPDRGGDAEGDSQG